MGNFGETLNINGKRMLEFCIENELLVGNTYYNQKVGIGYNFLAEERNGRSGIDFIMYTRDIQHEIKDIKTNHEAEMGSSNNRLVSN